MENLGFEKDEDWIEWRLEIPRETGVPERLMKVAELAEQRYGVKIVKFKKAKQIAKRFGKEIFDVINEAFAPLFGYSELSDRQKEQYVKMYLGIVDPKLVSTITDKDGKLIGTGICMPSLSEALQKCKGKLFPFGWYHLLKALKWKHSNHLEMLLIAIRPEWQSKGVNALFFKDLLPYFISEGYDWCETSVELERNAKVQNQWRFFEGRIHKRRRCWKKIIKST
jgi:GNAT superfamily N-acetyltransferase